MVHLDNYHVFLTPYGGSDVMAVTERTASGFHVEVANEMSDTAFSWRVVATRKDIPGPRFETVTIPLAQPLPRVVEPQPVPTPAMPGARADHRR
jgi:hypothetical protein